MKIFKMLVVGAMVPAMFAHRQWLLPSTTVISAKDAWVTVDAAVSNELFYFDHVPMRLMSLVITAPDGSRVEPQNPATGKYRSTFDVNLKQEGTYRIANVNQMLFATWTANGEQKTWRGAPEAFAKEVPQDATDLKKFVTASRVETFVTSGKPTTEAMKPTGVGLEIAPITHPNDVVVGEEVKFQLLRDGKPAAGMEVTVIAGGIRYRNNLNEIKVKADAEGKLVFTLKEPGMYWLNATTGGGRGPGGPGGPAGGPRPAGAPAGGPPMRMPTGNNANYVLTFEALPQ